MLSRAWHNAQLIINQPNYTRVCVCLHIRHVHILPVNKPPPYSPVLARSPHTLRYINTLMLLKASHGTQHFTFAETRREGWKNARSEDDNWQDNRVMWPAVKAGQTCYSFSPSLQEKFAQAASGEVPFSALDLGFVPASSQSVPCCQRVLSKRGC